MNQTLNEVKATPERLRILYRKEHLSQSAFARGLVLIGHTPQRAAWAGFINLLLLGLGALLLISGIFFFLAYNWADLPRMTRFGAIQIAIVVSALLATWAGLDRIPGKIALTFTALLIGTLLVVFGQEYQTGADSWELFWNWALLITAVALVARFDLLWAIWLGLLNLTLFLYWDQVQTRNEWLGWEFLCLLNVAALAIWELWGHWRKADWMQSRWLPRLIAVVAFGWILIPTVSLIFDWFEAGEALQKVHQWAPLLYVVFLLAVFFLYQSKTPDLFMLTAAALSLIIVITAFVGRWLTEADDVFGTLITGVLVIVEAALAAYWLRDRQKRMEPTQ